MTLLAQLLEEYLELILENCKPMALLATDMAVRSHPEIGGRTAELNERLLGLVAGSEPGLEGQMRAAIAFGALQIAVIRFYQADPEAVREEALRTAESAARAGQDSQRGGTGGCAGGSIGSPKSMPTRKPNSNPAAPIKRAARV